VGATTPSSHQARPRLGRVTRQRIETTGTAAIRVGRVTRRSDGEQQAGATRPGSRCAEWADRRDGAREGGPSSLTGSTSAARRSLGASGRAPPSLTRWHVHVRGAISAIIAAARGANFSILSALPFDFLRRSGRGRAARCVPGIRHCATRQDSSPGAGSPRPRRASALARQREEEARDHRQHDHGPHQRRCNAWLSAHRPYPLIVAVVVSFRGTAFALQCGTALNRRGVRHGNDGLGCRASGGVNTPEADITGASV